MDKFREIKKIRKGSLWNVNFKTSLWLWFMKFYEILIVLRNFIKFIKSLIFIRTHYKILYLGGFMLYKLEENIVKC